MFPRIAIVLFVGIYASPLLSQSPGDRKNVTVRVLNASAVPGSPVRDARVAITFLADGTPITDAIKTTNAVGEAYLVVSREKAEEGNLRIELSGVNDLVVYQPADGQIAGVSDKPIILLLLPKGSLVLLGPPQIEATLKRLSLRVSALQTQNRSLRSQLLSAQAPRDVLAAAIAQWARANGFPEQEVQDKVREWAEDIQAHAQQKSQEQMALAQFALKNYAAAGDSFQQASESAFARAREVRKDAEERDKQYHNSIAQALSDAVSGAHTLQLALQYHRATSALQDATNALAKERQENSKDDYVTRLWLECRGHLAETMLAEGEIVTGGGSSRLLSQSVEQLKSLEMEYENRADKWNRAAAETALGNALIREGERTSGEASPALFAQAVQVYERALEVRTKADLPSEWAATENNLGLALLDQAERTSGGASTALFFRAVQNFQRALEIRTRSNLPQDWAATQSNLGIAWMDQGERTSGEASTALFSLAAQALRSVLEIYDETDAPRDWARAQTTLGNALVEQAERTLGENSTALFGQAVQAYQKALEVRTKTDLPQDWAATQNNLGVALKEQAEKTSGEISTALFGQAVQAYQKALEVRTKADLPQDWAATESNLCTAFIGDGERASGATPALLFNQAVQACQNALNVYTRTDLPQDWARTQNNLGVALTDLSERTSGEASSALFTQAVQAYQNALEIYTSKLPQDWARTQKNLGDASKERAERISDSHSLVLFTQAADAYQKTLKIYNRADLPHDWAEVEYRLGRVLAELGDFVAAKDHLEQVLSLDPNSAETLKLLAGISQDSLFDYDRAYKMEERLLKLDSSAAARLNFAEVSLSAERYGDCLQQITQVNDQSISPPQIAVRDALQLACHWALFNRADAVSTAKLLAFRAVGLQKSGFSLAGTIHFVSASPAFAIDRASWIDLFTSVRDANSDVLLDALRRLEQMMKS